MSILGFFCNAQFRIRTMLELSKYTQFFLAGSHTWFRCIALPSSFLKLFSPTTYQTRCKQMHYVTFLNNATVFTEFWQWIKVETGDLDQVNTVYLAKSLVVVFFNTVSKITTSSTWRPYSPTVRTPIVKLA